MRTQSAEGFSDSSLTGTWLMRATLKPYVKFGGPQVGSGKLRFDGHGNVSGQVVNFGVPADLKGTYHVGSDGPEQLTTRQLNHRAWSTMARQDFES